MDRHILRVIGEIVGAILRGAVEGGRATWTDERLDDLARRMDQGFARVDADIRALSARIDARLDAQGEGLNTRIDALQRTMLVMMATIVVGFAAQIAAQLWIVTQL